MSGAVQVKGAPKGHKVPTGTTAGTVAAGDDARFGGGGGAPTTATYVVVSLDATLTAERRLQVSADLILTDGGANGDITVGLASGVYKAGGTDVAVADGGTGASTAANARTNLGLAIGSDVAVYDAGIASLATVDTAADLLPYTTAANAWAATSLTASARGLLDDASYAAMRTTLGLGSIATLSATPSGGDFVTDWPATAISSSVITAAARTVLDDATVGAMLTTLGGVAKSTYTAKGSILVATAASTPADHVAGADFACPMYDSTQSDGLSSGPMIPWPSLYHFGMTSIGATTARNDTGAIASAFSGTTSSISTAARRAVRYTSTATTGSAAEVHANGYETFRRDRGAFQVSFRFQTGSSLAVCRWYIGNFSGAPTNTDTLGATKAVGLRYSTVAGDAGFVPISSDGTTQTVAASILAIATSTDYLVDIEYDGTSTFRVRINSGSWTNITATLPGTTVVTGPFVGVYTNENVAKVLDFSWLCFRAPA